jgi:hypothetical protein
MDDFSVSGLNESKNEWCARLLNVLTPTIVQGVKSIFDEAWKLCQDNKETDKYLMTFQNFLTRVPKWNQTIIDTEKTRIIETSGCTYLEELITCVHIIQLKVLTSVRVGSKQKKIDIDVPSVSDFIHKIYIHVARKLYTNIYLYEKNIQPLQTQKNNREMELIIKECILSTIRDSIPVESILRAYMDETDEQDVEVTEVEEPLPDIVDASANAVGANAVGANAVGANAVGANAVGANAVGANKVAGAADKVAEGDKAATATADKAVVAAAKEKTAEDYKQTSDFTAPSKLSFSNNDIMVDTQGSTSVVASPKDEKRLEELEAARALEQSEEEDEDEDEDERLTIGDNVTLDIIDVNDLNKAASKIDLEPPKLDFEILS